MSDEWITIPNWKRFQHYGKRRPVWIKVYTHLNSDPDWEGLSLHQRGIMITVWIEFARSRGQVSLEMVRRWVGVGFKMASVEALVNAGFIELSASRPPKLRASPEEETEREEEKEPPLPPTEVGEFLQPTNDTKPTNSRAAATNPRAVAKTVQAIDKDEAHRELLTQAAHLAKTWDGTDSAHFDQALDELERTLQSRLSFGERDDLWEKAFHLGF